MPDISLIDESDRGAVLVGAVMLEERLSQLIKDTICRNNIPESHIKEMFNLNGPLSSFSSKSLICYGFGLISKDIFDDLTKIRKLRNKMAHSLATVDFLSRDMKKDVMSIKCCINAANSFKGKRYNIKTNQEGTDQDLPCTPPEWEMRTMGYVKSIKYIFCIGIYLLLIDISKYQIYSIKSGVISALTCGAATEQ
ncbi:MAG: MltR family transcriptional regulator [Planctomycetia bacterium]|jgi:hypothetical protein|nr:MltR family transcriptional regulator [Planctomycetia bacterium]